MLLLERILRPAFARPRRIPWNRVAKLVRRVHLYSGLALVPFVVLYGVTAYLMNHPTAGTESTAANVGAGELREHGWIELPAPEALAASVAAAVAKSDGWELDPERPARFRGRVALAGAAGERELGLSREDPSGKARFSSRPRRNAEPVFTRTLALPAVEAAVQSWKAAARSLFAAQGHPAEAVAVRAAPVLEMGLRIDGAPRRASFELEKGVLKVHAASTDDAPSLRSFLLRLHTTHGYPASVGPGFLWALLVDAMAVAMVLWAASGIAMWWQVRFLRRAGAIALVCGLALALALGGGMWSLHT